MQTLTSKRHFARSIIVMMVGLLVLAAPRTSESQGTDSNLVRLFRLDGTFSEELSGKIKSDDNSRNPGFTLSAARLEADNFGFLTRLRVLLTIANGGGELRITEVEWRVDVYDATLRSASVRFLQTEKINIYAGESRGVSAKAGAVLPDRMVVLLQITKVSFADGSAWAAPEECSVGPDLRTVTCKSK